MPNRDEIDTSILFLKHNGLSDSDIIQSLENPLSGRKGFSKKEIDRAFQNLLAYGFIDKNGLITEEGIDFIDSI